MSTETIPAHPNALRGVLRAVVTGLSAYVSTMGVLLVAGGLAYWHGVFPPDMTFGEFWRGIAPMVLPLVVLTVVLRWLVAVRWAR